MTFAGVNYLAVLVASIASFLLGWVWYGLIFREQWLAATGQDRKELEAQGAKPMLMAVTFIAQFVMALMLAGVMGHMGGDAMTAKNGAIAGVACWLGFVITTMVVNHGFQGAQKSLTWIDGGHWLAVLAIQGAILGWMGLGGRLPV